MDVAGETRFKRFFRVAAGLNVDESDLTRYQDFVADKVYDMVLIAGARAKANNRDVIQPWDLPITKGLQESMHAFKKLDAEVDSKPILARIAARPPIDLALSDEVDPRLIEVAGGLTLALARCFTIIDPKDTNPGSKAWSRVIRVFNLLL
ncbi:MAG: hypothetical protein JWO57_4057 [Pseudonocardiales bacterium]|nr:hypothetical protein [Pseudonocardiales bacterium]